MTLQEYLAAHAIAPREFAARLGVQPITVTRWIKGQRFPRPEMLRQIERATAGRVTASALLPEEREGAGA